MKFGKVITILTVVFAASLAVLIETPAILKGQHVFVNISTNSVDINCTSCHPQIADELARSQIHSNFACEECHRIKVTAEGKTITYAESNSTTIISGKEAHAAYVPRCLDCHNSSRNPYQTYDGTWKSVGFPAFTSLSAHKGFVEWAKQSGLAVGENEACLACHTNFSLKITLRYFYNISFTKTADWNITNFRVNGTREYIVTVAGSKDQGKHEWLRIGDRARNCIGCHKNVYEALVNGTPSSPYTHYTHAPIEIDRDDPRVYRKDHDWPLSNYWGNPRYHYVADKSTVDNNYCMDCHSGGGHAAKKVTCLDCHGPGKPNDPYDVLLTRHQNNWYNNDIAEWHKWVMANISRFSPVFVGDLCMACHQAAGHNVYEGANAGRCRDCHGGMPSLDNYYGGGPCGACHWNNRDLQVNIESEPSGYSVYYVPGYNPWD